MGKKYKILITSGSKVVIDLFFTHMSDDLELISSSGRFEDLENHLRYFVPDLFVFGFNHENRNYIYRFEEFREKCLTKKGIPMAVIGTEEECGEYADIADTRPDLVIYKSQSSSRIYSQLSAFLDGKAMLEAQKRKQEEQKAQEEQKELEEQAAAQKAEEEQEKERQEKTRRKHILIIDDDPLMLRSIKKQLEEDYDIATAISGKLAMRFLDKKKTDMIFLDYEMPEEDGPTVLAKLREQEKTKDVPVVFLTGVADRNKIQEALSLKPQGYLLKPIEHEKLIAIIDKLTGGNGEKA